MRKQIVKWIPYIVICIALLVFYFIRYRMAPEIEFAELKATDKNGNVVILENLMAEKSVIHFYASWCGPCIREMKSIAENFEDLKSSGIQFIFITDDPEENVATFISTMPSEISFLRINSLQEIGIYTLPTTYFTHKKIVTEKHVEALNWDNMNEVNLHFENQ